jgi:ribosomal protein L21E
LSKVFSSAKQKRVRKIARILLGSFEKGDHVKVVRMPSNESYAPHWLPEWVGLEGVYIESTGPLIERISRVYFGKVEMCSPTTGWLVQDSQLDYISGKLSADTARRILNGEIK